MPVSKFERMIALALEFLEEGNPDNAIITLATIQLLIQEEPTNQLRS